MFSVLDEVIGGMGRKVGNLEIPFHLLQQATDNFNEKWVIGRGGFGKVYKGELEGGTKVAVKRRNPNSSQGEEEFQVEIGLLTVLKDDNLVSLIGYCNENTEMILVYEYMEGGTLKSHLYGSGKPPLSWVQRLNVSVEAAKGLLYLHSGSAKANIHRDVKSANILLDGKLCAKVGDFGISKIGLECDQTHVTTVVKGTPGYLDPEYFMTHHLTKKSDVYSFGVVLLEVLCGRSLVDYRRPEAEVSLVKWGKRMLKEEKVEQIVDREISDTINTRLSLKMFGKIVVDCLEEKSDKRPSMEDIVKRLEDVQRVEVKRPLKRCLAKKHWGA